MELCTTLDMIGHYFTKVLLGSQFRFFHNIIIGIHEDDTFSYNASGRELLEERKRKLQNDKEEAQEAAKITGK